MFKIYLLRFFMRIFYIFPIKKNRIVLTSYNGRQYSCSPKYITENLDKNKYETIFALKNNCNLKLPDGVKIIKYKSLKHIFYLMTAKYIILNSTGFTCYLPFRKKQIFVNTWHGFAYKSIGISHFSNKKDILKRKLIGDNITYFLSPSKTFSNQQEYSMCIDSKKFLNIGLPRNDIFFEKDNIKIKEKVKKTYSIPNEYGIILYAPTYRDGAVTSINDYDFENIDIEKLLTAAKKRFNKNFVFIFRAHHDMIPDNLDSNCINASSYDDIQELLYASDILITDYSSCMWDYALMFKPGFLYTPDLKQYQKVHSFEFPIEKWPYKYSTSNETLIKDIEEYNDNDGKKKIKKHFDDMGSYENGNASKALIKIFDEKIDS